MTAPHTPTRFLDRHLGTTGADLDTVLTRIGARSLEDLAVRVVPTTLPVLDPPQQPERPDAVVGGLSEDEAVGALRSLAALNDPHTEMIGCGYHPALTPAVIARDVLGDPAWTTAYTPYQAEISQGRLEAQLLFQTVVADLTGLPVACTSLLDEATASLDPENEVEVQRAVNALVEGRTVVVIAHKLRTTQNADNIVVMEAGRVVDQGRYEELLERGGLYARLWALQNESVGWSLTGD